MEKAKVIPISKKDYVAAEFIRLIYAIPQTDPRSRDYAQLLENIERFAAAATMFDDLWVIFNSYYPDGEPEPQIVRPKFEVVQADEEPEEPPVEEEQSEPEEEPVEETPAEPEPEYDATEVKKAIGKARADGKLPKIKDWLLENWGVEGFSALPASKYGEAMAKLKEMGVV